jgi:sulfoxide reductase heme-binding subunit YedZ
VLHLTTLILLLVTCSQGFTDQLCADLVKAILHLSGIGNVNLLFISLLIYPLAKYLRQGQLIMLERPIGLYALAYAICYFRRYLIIELRLQWSLNFYELLKRH